MNKSFLAGLYLYHPSVATKTFQGVNPATGMSIRVQIGEEPLAAWIES